MQLCHPLVITPEKGNEVLRQIIFIHLGKRAHNAKIKRDILPEGSRRRAHHNVARVHFRMKKAISEYLRKKDGDTITREFFEVESGIAQTLSLADGYAVHALHHNHPAGAA